MTILDEGTSMSPEQRAAQEAKTPHSGKAGVEFPVLEFDNTTLKEAQAMDLLRTPETSESIDHISNTVAPRVETSTTQPEKPSKRRRNIILGGVAAGAAAVVAAIGLTGISQNNTAEPTPTSETGETPVGTGDVTYPGEETDQTGNESENGTPASGETEPSGSEHNVLTPEVLATMSPEEIQAYATITVEEAPTPQEYAQQFIDIRTSWLNAGGTYEEWGPYSNNAPDEYENAMIAKYDTLFNSSLFMPGQGDGIQQTHYNVLNRHGLDHLIAGEDSTYTATVELLPESVEVVAQEGENFTINFSYNISDNWNQTEAYEVAGTGQTTDADNTWQLQVISTASGAYSIVHAELL